MTTPGPDPAAQGLVLTPPRTATNTATTLITPLPTQAGNGQPAPNPPTGQNNQNQQNNNATATTQNTINNNTNTGTTAPTNTTTLTLPPLAPYLGPFATTCRRFPITDDLAEAHRTRNTYDTLFHTPATTPNDRATILNAQPPPLPMLSINLATNTVAILHGITKFYPPLGLHQGAHPVAGSIIAFMGEAPYPGALPPVVTVPITAFEDESLWPAASDTMIATANPADTVIQPDGQHNTQMSRLIPLPPRMVPILLEHANDTLIEIIQLIKTLHDTAPPPTQQMCALPVQFLRAAIIATQTPTTNAPESQLAIPLIAVTMDQTITQWATARYSFYRMHPTTTAAQLPPNASNAHQPATHGNTGPLGPQNQQPQLNAPQQPPNIDPPLPPQLGQPLQHPPIIDVLDDDTPPTAHDQPPADRHLIDIVTASVSAAFKEQYKNYGAPTARHTLEAAIPDKAPAITGMELTNLYSWCGLMEGEPLPPFWKVFGEATTESGRTYVLDAYLKAAQRANNQVQYTIRPDFIRDLKIRKFHYTPTVENIHRGITPLALQKLTATQTSALIDIEDATNQASNVGVQDILRRNRSTPRHISPDPHSFLELLATFSAITKILFGTSSPLYIDAEALYKIALRGHSKDHLLAIRAHHPDWFAHVRWAVTTSTREFFEGGLRMDQLDLGERLPRPIQHLFALIVTFNKIENGLTPNTLKPPMPPHHQNQTQHQQPAQAPTETAQPQPQQQPYAKRPHNPDTDNPYKRQKIGQPTGRTNRLPDSLYKLQQTLLRKAPGTPLTQVLRAAGQNITTLIKTAGVPKDTCCRLLFWGRCNEASCILIHDPITLTPDVTEKVIALLQPGAQKIADQAPTQN